jgi:hypothetical protein
MDVVVVRFCGLPSWQDFHVAGIGCLSVLSVALGEEVVA